MLNKKNKERDIRDKAKKTKIYNVGESSQYAHMHVASDIEKAWTNRQTGEASGVIM